MSITIEDKSKKDSTSSSILQQHTSTVQPSTSLEEKQHNDSSSTIKALGKTKTLRKVNMMRQLSRRQLPTKKN